MLLFTKAIKTRLLKNGKEMQEADYENQPDFKPVVKLFTPTRNFTWLLTELDPDNEDIAFALCDLGMGFPELGSVSITEITSSILVERDRSFKATHTISEYAEAARKAGQIIEFF